MTDAPNTASSTKRGKQPQPQQSKLRFSVFHIPSDILAGLRLPSQLNNNKVYSSKATDNREKQAEPLRAHYSTPTMDYGDHSSHMVRAFAAARLAKPTCHTCGGVEFETTEEQRSHFKSSAHQVNMARKMAWRKAHADVEVEANEYPWEPMVVEGMLTADDADALEGTRLGGNSDESNEESAWSESDVSVVGGDDDGDGGNAVDSFVGSGPVSAEHAAAGGLSVVGAFGSHGRATMDAEALAQELEAQQKSGLRGNSLAGSAGAAAGDSDDGDSDGGKRPGGKDSRHTAPYLWFAPAAEPSSNAGSESEPQAQARMTMAYGIQRRILVPKGQHGVHIDSDQVLRDLVQMQLPVAPAKKTQLELKGSEPKVSENSSVWVLLAINGGFFAGAVYDNRTGAVVAHKTIQRYTTRRKQGGSQARQDNAMGKAANSAGAQIRRHNEQKLQDEVQELMALWRPLLHDSTRVFVRVPRTQHRGFFGPAGDAAAQAMQWSDPRIRSVPVAMGRPSLSELNRVYKEITTVRVRSVTSANFATAAKPAPAALAQPSGGMSAADAAAIAAAMAGESSGEESDHTLEPEPRPDLLAFLFHVAKLVLDEVQSDQQIIDYLNANMVQLLDALSDPAIGLRYLGDTGSMQAHRTPTLLHLAALQGRVALVPYLMDHGEDPTVTNGHPPLFAGGMTAYEVARDRPTRDAFRVYRFEHADDKGNAVEWERSRVPDEPLSREKQEENEAKARERKRKERERRKNKDKEKKERKAKAKSQAEADDEQALDQALQDKQQKAQEDSKTASWKDGLRTMSESELRVRMLSMAYASAGSWGASGAPSTLPRMVGGGARSNPTAAAESTPQRPLSPASQRARDRELRLQAIERRQQQGQQQNRGGAVNVAAGGCTHCGKLLHGLTPFEQFDWKCCSLKCLKEHRIQFG
ncbi:hypothetical protein LPJ66_005045 [Kickxella alabastrina]|uniref:Uncharacterized protein n=1 Tax=Kickxella alabastrina TaxID=61397 RepID=A0ACC1IJY9_9FUNG|nr:hypothetical protein LPJ66_005045 [Kickxella alabastrina]